MPVYSESTTVELKREINADFQKEIVAFANTDGGDIYIGLEKDGAVVGVDNPDEVMAQVGNMIRDGIKPDLTAYTSINTIVDSGKNIIRVAVLRGTKRPYHLSEKGLKPGGVFVRHGVSSVPATDEVIRSLLRDSDGVVFDKSRSLNQELSFMYACNYFNDKNIGFNDVNKRTLGIIDGDGYYTNAAFLLSDQCTFDIKCAVYDGVGKMKFKTRKEFTGSVLKQADDAHEFISINNNLNSTFVGLKRVDHPDYPDFALREALLNAIIHRDYDYSGSIIVNIFNDRIEFISLGGLVKGITLEDILGGVSLPRNSIVASIFYRLELIEAYGTGIQRIFESYGTSVRKPVFRPAPASFIVTLPKTTDDGNFIYKTNHNNESSILNAIREQNEISRKDIELIIGQSKFAALKIIEKLIDDGIIVKTGSARAVKYRLSE